jgi:hypothetical protein
LTLISRVNQAIKLSLEWFKRKQREDFGWSKYKQVPSNVRSTSESIDALITLGEDISCPSVRKGILWLIENSDIWGNEALKGNNTSKNKEEGLDDLCWGLIGLDRCENVYVRKLFSKKLDLLLSRQITLIEDDLDRKCFGLYIERPRQFPELLGLYSSALALKIMCRHFSIDDQRIQNLIHGLRRYRAKDGGWPTRLNPDRESDPCYTAIILESLLCGGVSVKDEIVSTSLKFLENELMKRGCLWSEWIEEGFEKRDKIEQVSTEATGQGLITLLKSGYDPTNNAITKAVEWLLSDDIFVWQGKDKGGFRLFPQGPILNYSTYYGSVALKTFFDVVQNWDKLKRAYRIDSSKIDIENKAFLSRFLVGLGLEKRKPSVTISNLKQLRLLENVIKGKIKDRSTIERIWCVLQTLNNEGPLTLDELEDQVRIKTNFLQLKKKSWKKEMHMVLSRINELNLLMFYKKDGTIKEVSSPTSEHEYSESFLKKVKVWIRLDF